MLISVRVSVPVCVLGETRGYCQVCCSATLHLVFCFSLGLDLDSMAGLAGQQAPGDLPSPNWDYRPEQYPDFLCEHCRVEFMFL